VLRHGVPVAPVGLGHRPNLSHPLGTVATVKILHTSDWHVGRSIRGRSRADEHEAVLAEIGSIARAEEVDVVLVVGDLFESKAPTAESEEIVFRALLDLASTGATVVVVAGNHDSARRLEALQPLLELGRIVARPGAAEADEGGVVEVRSKDGRERGLVATLPFLSQRQVVSADDLVLLDAGDHRHRYAVHVAGRLARLAERFEPDTVNLVAAHLTVTGGRLGGGERAAHTVFDYEVPAGAFPSSAQYVALGHLHRRQRLPGDGEVHYCGSPLALDFGEVRDTKAVLVVEARAGEPASVRDVPLRAGRPLRVVRGTFDQLAATVVDSDAWLKVVVEERARTGLADEVRDLFPTAVDVCIAAPAPTEARRATDPAAQRSPTDLFTAFLADRGVDDPDLARLFADVLDEVESAGDEPLPVQHERVA